MKGDNRILRRWILPVLLLAVVAVVCAALLLPDRDVHPGGTQLTHPPGGTESVNTGPAQTAPGETAPGGQTEHEGPAADDQPEQTEPDEDVSDRDPEPEPTVQTEPVKYADADDLFCRQFSRFSGQFVEDGRDELVEHVAAMLVTNRSDQYLDLATLTYDIDGYEATFVVTGLPAGRSAWVMEAGRLVIPDDAVFQLLDCVTAFRSDVTVDTDTVSLYAEANMLTAVNNTRDKLEGVFVYYKTLHTDGNFFGGITYRVDFGDLEPGCAADALAGHYSVENSEIVRIGWAGQ